MNVYTTRRTAALPKGVTDRVVARAGKVTLQGFGLQDLGGSTTPFPIPQSGLEAIWNHLVRYLGGGAIRSGHTFPVRGNGDYFKIGFTSKRIYAENIADPEPNRLFYALGYFTEPATLKGTSSWCMNPWTSGGAALGLDLQLRRATRPTCPGPQLRRRERWIGGHAGHGPGGRLQRRARRYDWKLVGKREMYIPYNVYRLSDKSIKYKDIIGKHTINSDLVRYELHRVWIVEGTLKPAHATCTPSARSISTKTAGASSRRTRTTREAACGEWPCTG